MHEVILLKYGEIVLKGLNRPTFESRLLKNIRYRLRPCGKCSITSAQSTVYVEPENESFDMDQAVACLRKVFGLSTVARACVVQKDMDAIEAASVPYLRETLSSVKTFKVEAKRADKRFPLKSPQIASRMGEILLNAYGNLKVDVHDPDVVVMVEIRDFGAYIHAGTIPGAGGMPAGSNGKAAVLISGGIDSPVAAYMMAKRGLELTAVHFASPPYTSERAKLKVLELLKIVSSYSGRIHLFVVPFTKIQEEIRKNCPEDYFTLVMRRIMMKTAGRIAKSCDCQALITGESVGQVASQTVEALTCTEAASPLPVFRPLIGMDKEEIIHIARAVGTFETSIQPYEDCCTVFTPKHPCTRPKLANVERAENAYDFAPLVDRAVANSEEMEIDQNSSLC